MELKDKIVVITGSTKGLGKELAILFSKEGARVITSAREQGRSDMDFFIADVANEKDVENLAKYVKDKYGRIDLWINNAGIWFLMPDFIKADSEKIHQMMDVNFFGTFHGSREAAKIMREQGNGTILNICSISGLNTMPRSVPYASTKWAVQGFTKSIRKALEPEGISVLIAHPGLFQSEIFGENKPSTFNEAMTAEYVAEQIIKNLKQDKPKEEIIIDN